MDQRHHHREYRRLSLWWDQLPDELAGPQRPRLPGHRDADVAIVGAGFSGLWTAYYLLSADPSTRIVVIEQEAAGFGGSGRAGGWCSALFPAPHSLVARWSSREAAIRLQQALDVTVDEVQRVAGAEGIDCRFAKGGTISLVRSEAQEKRARNHMADELSWGFDDLSWLDADPARQRLAATGVRGATLTPNCAAIDPARLVRALALAVERLGGVIYEGTRATSIEPGVVRTDVGNVRAERVIRATEAFTPLLPGLRRTVAPVYSLMLATEPLPDEVWEQIGLRDRETFADYRRLIIYGQRTADGRIAFGGRGAPYHYGSTVRPEHDHDARVQADLRRTLVELLPVLRDVAVTHTWGGAVGVSFDWTASVGLDERTGVGWAGGYVGDGIGTSNLAGRTLADLIRGERSDLATLPWVNHRWPRWPPEPLRWVGTNLVLRGVMAADRVEARAGRPSVVGRAVDRLLGH
ncbi:MAG: FAD-binding oxidoreductase [Candidatus Nanopelagicales bacterium]